MEKKEHQVAWGRQEHHAEWGKKEHQAAQVKREQQGVVRETGEQMKYWRESR